MSIRFLLASAIILTLLGGCRQNPHLQVYIDSMNAEKRLLEDTLYELQYDYESKSDEVEKLRRELDQLKGTGGGAGGSGSGAGNSSSRPSRGDLFPEIPDLTPPTVEPGTRSNGKSPQRDGPKEIDKIEGLEPPKLELGDEKNDLSVSPVPVDQPVTQLYLDPTLTGGEQRDDEPGDDGIVIVFEPRDADNHFVPLPARVTVVLLDPDKRTRVARWEFDESHMEKALRKAGAGQGIELHMPWPDAPPQQSRLHLFVRYWLPGGRAVEQDREITITPSNKLASRWTPRSERRPAPRRINLAENLDPQPPELPASSRSGNARDAAETFRNVPDGSRDSGRQDGRPQWRPYR